MSYISEDIFLNIFWVIKRMSTIRIVLVVKYFINIGFDVSIKGNFWQQIYLSFESASKL